MYYAIVKKMPVEIEGIIQDFPRFISYNTLEELLNDNPGAIEYLICDENHKCTLYENLKDI